MLLCYSRCLLIQDRDFLTLSARRAKMHALILRRKCSASRSGAHVDLPNRKILISSLPALILAVLCLVPYLTKAYTADDPYFLLQSNQIRVGPLHPMAFDICWFVPERCGAPADCAPGAALGGYYLLPVVICGTPEWLA